MIGYGIESAPESFHSVMDQVPKGIKNVVCFLGDIPIATKKR